MKWTLQSLLGAPSSTKTTERDAKKEDGLPIESGVTSESFPAGESLPNEDDVQEMDLKRYLVENGLSPENASHVEQFFQEEIQSRDNRINELMQERRLLLKRVGDDDTESSDVSEDDEPNSNQCPFAYLLYGIEADEKLATRLGEAGKRVQNLHTALVHAALGSECVDEALCEYHQELKAFMDEIALLLDEDNERAAFMSSTIVRRNELVTELVEKNADSRTVLETLLNMEDEEDADFQKELRQKRVMAHINMEDEEEATSPASPKLTIRVRSNRWAARTGGHGTPNPV